MSKEFFIAAHMELVEQYLNDHPEADWGEAYDKTADGAYDRMRDNLADAADCYKDRAKESSNWPPRRRIGNEPEH